MTIRNPLNYWCAPNEATPSYVPSHDMKDFIAYGLMISYIDPDDVSHEYEVTDDAIDWLRKGFLECIEITAVLLPNASIGQKTDCDSFGNGVSLYRRGMNEPGDPEKYIEFEWSFDMRDNFGNVGLRLSHRTENGEEDGQIIWVDSRCFNNKRRLARLIESARQACKLCAGGTK